MFPEKVEAAECVVVREEMTRYYGWHQFSQVLWVTEYCEVRR